MFIISVSAVLRNLNKYKNIRCLSLVHASPTESYLRHAGTEPLTEATLSEALLQTVEKYPQRVALRSVPEDVTLTYEHLLKQADSLACALRAQGLQKGDRFGIWSHNSAAWVVATMAAVRAGFISVLLNPAYEKPELSFCIKKTGLKGLFIGQTLPNRQYYRMLTEMIPGLPEQKPGALTSKDFPGLTTIISAEKDTLGGTFSIDSILKDYENQDASKFSKEVSCQDGCIIHLTSGTTGQPKAAVDSNRGLVNNSYFIGKRMGCHEEHHNVCMQVPLFHALGSIVSLLGGLRHGATITLASPLYNVKNNLNTLFSEKCSIITGTPTMFIDMLTQLQSSGTTEKSDLKLALAAGAPCSPQLIRDMNKKLNVSSVKTLYGLSESTASIFQSISEDTVDIVADTVGYIQDHLEVKVVDEHGATVPWGASGELLSRGYNTMLHYWDDPEKTAKVISEDGWLSTGDKFTLSRDGYGRIVGRLKDIIVRGGENIAPKEIEDLLNTHPDIIESQVVGVADERVGEELCCVVRVKTGTTVTLQDASQFLQGKIARFKIPRILKTIDDFPKTTSGKIQKYKVKELVESGKL